jgi:hypothetical protein
MKPISPPKGHAGEVGGALDIRYILMQKVLCFEHESFDGVNIYGISFMRTFIRAGHVRSGDTETGEVAWQGLGVDSETVDAVEPPTEL